MTEETKDKIRKVFDEDDAYFTDWHTDMDTGDETSFLALNKDYVIDRIIEILEKA